MLELRRDLRDDTYLHATLQTRELELTEKNKELISENADLRDFTKDSRVVKANMLKLKEQRDDIKAQI
jgi:hypothetical protein